MNLVINPSFEGSWTDDIVGATKNQIPEGWELTYVPIGENLRSFDADIPDDAPHYLIAETIPECVHKGLFNGIWNLPVEERPSGARPLILEGIRVYKAFSNFKPWGIQLRQVRNYKPGARRKLTWPVNVHNQGDGSSGAAAFRFGVNGDFIDWKTFKRDFQDRTWTYYSVEYTVPSDGSVEIIGQFESRSLAGIDFFMDKVTDELISDPQPIESGDPRVQYERTYVLLPSKNVLSFSDFSRLMGLLSNQLYDRQWTVGFSADDAGIGKLDAKNVIVVSTKEGQWDEEALNEFFATYYPGTYVEFVRYGQATHFPVGTDQYPPKYWYSAQNFTSTHFGIDLNLDIAPWGDVERGYPIYAVLDGEVYYTTDSWSGVGMCVIKHELEGETFYVQYAHVDLNVVTNQQVIAGQIIGHIANYTQGQGGDHLHFAVSTKPVTREYSNFDGWINPTPWLKRFISAEIVDSAIAKGDHIEPPTGGDPGVPTYKLRSNNTIGLHSGYQKTGWDKYLVNAKPIPQKVFSVGFAIEAKRLAPEALVVYRKYVGDYGIKDDYKSQAKGLVDIYSREVEVTANNMGISEDEVLRNVDVFESMNETIPTFNVPYLQKAVAFDWWFAEYLYERFGDKVQAGLLTAAIGNPHETEVKYLIPAVEQAVKYNGWVTYHSYWTANENRSFLTEHWKYHAGRWTEWDKVFNQNNLYPRYYFGEGGIVYAHDGTSFNSGLGWKSCGDIENYIRDLDTFNNLVLTWNKTHNNRASGLTVFGYGNWGWDNFEIGEGDLKLMEEHFKGL